MEGVIFTGVAKVAVIALIYKVVMFTVFIVTYTNEIGTE